MVLQLLLLWHCLLVLLAGDHQLQLRQEVMETGRQHLGRVVQEWGIAVQLSFGWHPT
jgi:hypothetical protein